MEQKLLDFVVDINSNEIYDGSSHSLKKLEAQFAFSSFSVLIRESEKSSEANSSLHSISIELKKDQLPQYCLQSHSAPCALSSEESLSNNVVIEDEIEVISIESDSFQFEWQMNKEERPKPARIKAKLEEKQKQEKRRNANKRRVKRINIRPTKSIISRESSPNQSSFRRKKQLQQLISVRTITPPLIKQILCSNKRLHSLGIETPNRKAIDDYFQNCTEYQEQFSAHLINELVSEIREKIHMKINEPETPKIRFRINSQILRKDGLYDLKICNSIPTSTKLEIRQKSSKYRIGLLVHNQQVKIICSYPNLKRKLRKEEDIGFITGVEFNAYPPFEIDFYDLDKITTKVREYEAIHHLKWSNLAKIIKDPRTIVVSNSTGMSSHSHFPLQTLLQSLKPKFNSDQFAAIKNISNNDHGVFLIQGPPGTGKTSALLGLLSCELEKLNYYEKQKKFFSLNPKILICAPSNAAADHIADRIANEGVIQPNGDRADPKILRIGVNECGFNNRASLSFLVKNLLDLQRKYETMTQIQIKSQAFALQKQIGLLEKCEKTKNEKDSLLSQKRLNLKNLFLALQSSKEGTIFLKQSIARIEKKLILEAKVIITTLTNSYSQKIIANNLNFSCVIIDEAAQATEPSSIIPLQLGICKMVLIGDPWQLAPITQCPGSVAKKYNRSMFERFLANGVNPFFLKLQYRMAPLICQFPNEKFYQNRLLNAPQVRNRSKPVLFHEAVGDVIFINCPSQQSEVNKSYSNASEANLAAELVFRLLPSKLSIGVITPYSAQQEHIITKLRAREEQQNLRRKTCLNICKEVKVNTIDSYQGQQRDVIIISTVRSNNTGSIGFLADSKRVNVALTRARHAMVVLGNAQTLIKNEIWECFIYFVKRNNLFFDFSGSPQIFVSKRILLETEAPK